MVRDGSCSAEHCRAPVDLVGRPACRAAMVSRSRLSTSRLWMLKTTRSCCFATRGRSMRGRARGG